MTETKYNELFTLAGFNDAEGINAQEQLNEFEADEAQRAALRVSQMPIAQMTDNGMIKYFNADGSRNKEHGTGFYYKGAERILKSEGFKIVRQ